jgi:hypothetical protein
MLKILKILGTKSSVVVAYYHRKESIIFKKRIISQAKMELINSMDSSYSHLVYFHVQRTALHE